MMADNAEPTAPPLQAARVGPYLLLRTDEPNGDCHVDVFEVRGGPVHLESFSGNRDLPTRAACDHLTALLGRAPVPVWMPIPPEAGP